MSHNVTIRFDFSDTSKYASIPLYIGVSATFTTIFIYIQSELSPLDLHGSVKPRVKPRMKATVNEALTLKNPSLMYQKTFHWN